MTTSVAPISSILKLRASEQRVAYFLEETSSGLNEEFASLVGHGLRAR